MTRFCLVARALPSAALATALVLAPTFALAASDGEGGSSLPQLDVSTFPMQLFWLAISFALLYLLLSRITLPRLRRMVGRRDELIGGDLERAEQLRNEAEAMVVVADRKVSEAKREANQMILIARKEAEVICSAGLREADIIRQLPAEQRQGQGEALVAAAEERVLKAAKEAGDERHMALVRARDKAAAESFGTEAALAVAALVTIVPGGL